MATDFLHTHPYAPFLFPEATSWIVGTLPPPRFTTGALKAGDVDFSYGSIDGLLWPILNSIFNLNLSFKTTEHAIRERKDFLISRKIGICDIVAQATRKKINASDSGMQNVELRNIIAYLQQYPNVKTLLFTGGNSKNGPEYFFRKQLKKQGITFHKVSNTVPRIHEFKFPIVGKEATFRTLKTVSLTAPSGAANRAVGGLALYKERKVANANYTTFDFRVDQYKNFF